MPIKIAKINFADLLARRTIEAEHRISRKDRSTNRRIEPKRAIAGFARVPDPDDALGLAFGLASLGAGGELRGEFWFASVRAHARIIGARLF
jgi:hypothetical protein